jgi:predicted O-methyltransferase YrrM
VPEPRSARADVAPSVAAGTLDEVRDIIATIDGWLTDGQAALLWECASVLRSGDRIVEIGSYRGRSTIVLASGAPGGCEVVAIDPHAGTDRGPEEYHGKELEAERDHLAFEQNLSRAGVRDRVTYLRKWSHEAVGEIGCPIQLLYIDGAHRYQPARDDIRSYGARVAPGGTLLIHDSFSSKGVTAAILRTLTFGPRWRYVGRVGSMTEFRRSPVRPAERPLNAMRQLGELGWFARNLAIKLLVLARRRDLALRVGLPPDQKWPH